MRLGICTGCGTPYSTQDVVSYGILRPRPAVHGGPLMVYRCGTCNTEVELVPHGHGRYAPPGMPPPPIAGAQERQAPWYGSAEQRRQSRQADEAPVHEIPSMPPPPPPPPPGTGAQDGAAEEAPLTLKDACQLLGVEVTATPKAIEEAFRQQSLLCHPDKVAHLDPDFQALAQRKFLRLQAAHELLREATTGPGARE